MANDNLKQLLEEAIAPLRQDIKELDEAFGPLRQDIKELDEAFGPLRQDIKELDEAFGPLRQDIKELKQDVNGLKDVQENRLLPSVTELEMTVNSYADSYKINKHNIERVDTRLSTVENKLDIEVPEELKVPHFTSSSS